MKPQGNRRVSLTSLLIILSFAGALFSPNSSGFSPKSFGQKKESGTTLVRLRAEGAHQPMVDSLRSDRAWQEKVERFAASFGPGVRFSATYTYLPKKNFTIEKPPGELIAKDLLIPHEKTAVIPGAEKALYFDKLLEDPEPWNPFSGSLFAKGEPQRIATVVMEEVSDDAITLALHFDRDFKVNELDLVTGDVVRFSLPMPPDFTSRALAAEDAVIIDSSNLPLYYETVGKVKNVVLAPGDDGDAREKLVHLIRELGEPIPGRTREKAFQVAIRHTGFSLDEHIQPVGHDAAMPLVAPGIKINVCHGQSIRFPGIADALYVTRNKTVDEIYHGLVIVRDPQDPSKGIVTGKFSVRPDTAEADPGAVEFTFSKDYTLGTVHFHAGDRLVFFMFQQTLILFRQPADPGKGKE